MNVKIMSILAALVSIFCSGCRRGNAWQIVKQRTNDHFRLENYGYVNEIGHVYAGFKTKAEAEEAMKQARDAHRDPILSHWELVK